jgi:hypothetical protein
MVDDGSRDGTRDWLIRIFGRVTIESDLVANGPESVSAAKFCNKLAVRIVFHDKNKGKGGAIRTDGAMKLIATCPNVTGPINIGNPEEFTIRELAETIIRLSGSSSRISFHPLPQDDRKQRQPDMTKARDILGWKPIVQLEEGLEKTIAYFERLLQARTSHSDRNNDLRLLPIGVAEPVLDTALDRLPFLALLGR